MAGTKMNFIDLPRPHGFLISRGKQTAIASDVPLANDNILLEDGTIMLLVVSEGEAYGNAILAQPAQMSISEFEHAKWWNEKVNSSHPKHCIWPSEREMNWPEAEVLYVYEIKEFEPFSKPKIFINGEIADYHPTQKELRIIEQAARLPKQIILDPEAVKLCKGFELAGFIRDNEQLNKALKAVLGNVKIEDDEKELPLYSLALVRQPRLVFKKKDELKQEADMPWEITETHPECEGGFAVVKVDDNALEGCHKTEEEARAQLAALNIAEAEEDESALHEDEENEKEIHSNLLQERLEKIRGAFNNQFQDDGFSNWLIDASDEFAIADFSGKKFSIPYQELEDGSINFASQEEWREVGISYIEKMLGEKQGSFDDSPWDGSASRWDTAAAYCSDSLIDVNPAGEEKVKDLCFLPFRNPGAENPNKSALRAIAGGRGIGAVKKPEDVSADKWNSQLKAAANRLIGWWPGAFDKPAPDSIMSIAGKSEEKAGRRLKNTMLKRLREAMDTIKELMSWGDYDDNKALTFSIDDLKRGIAIKEVDGEPWHFMFSTNAFEDREGEIFSIKALENFVLEISKKEDKGTFDFWHIPGSDFADKQFIETAGRFLVEAGPYRKDFAGRSALEFFSEFKNGHPQFAPEGWGGSPEFKFLPEDRIDGIYDWLWIRKTTTLPRAAAANIWTEASQAEVKMTTLTGERLEAAIALFKDEDFVNNLIKEGEKRTEDLEGAGVAHKDKATEDSEKKEYSFEDMIEALSKQMTADIGPLAEAVLKLSESQKQADGRLEKLEDKKEISEDTELPRYAFQLIERASQAKETIVTEDDKLKAKKAAEAQENTTGGFVDSFFGQQQNGS